MRIGSRAAERAKFGELPFPIAVCGWVRVAPGDCRRTFRVSAPTA